MYLKLLDEFICAASNCPDDCCHGWNIHVDHETQSIWQRLPSTLLNEKMLDSLEVENQELMLQRDQSGKCTFLKSGLCEIQKELEHEMLPKTCQEYPRVTVGREDASTQSAFMSCPEVVRLLIDDEISSAEPLFKQRRNIDRFTLSDDPLQIENLLDVFINKLLTDKNIPLGEAVYAIGEIFHHLINPSTGSKTAGQLEGMCLDENVFRDYLNQNRKLFRNRRLQPNKGKAGEYWKLTIITCRVIKKKPYLELWNSSYPELAIDEIINADSSQIYSIILNLKKQLACQGQNMTDGLRKYLLVKLTNHGFPMACHEAKMHLVLLECLLSLSQIALLLYLRGQNNQLSDEALTEIIYKVERSLVHNDYLEQKLLEYDNFNSFAEYLKSFLVLL